MKRLGNMTQIELAEWVVATCLAFGSEVATAHKVAAVFVEGVEVSKKHERLR